MAEIEGGEKTWQPDTIAIAGAVVSIGHDGNAEINYGYVKPEDTPKKKPKGKTVTNPEDGTVTTVEEVAFTMSAALTESLTAHRTAALGAALIDNPAVALAAVVYSMALQVFYNGRSRDTCVQITAETASLRGVEQSTREAVDHAEKEWTERLAAAPDDLFAWCLEQKQETLLDLLAFCAARTVNAVRSKSDSADDERLLHADQIAAALRLDMAAWFRPTAANYFSRIGKTGIIAALQEVKGATAPAWAKVNKSELAALAERELADTGWLPAPLRRKA
jgi:ParB family chromosome partitioning protein